MRSEKGVESAQWFLRGRASTSLPTAQCTWTYTERVGEFLLSEARGTTIGEDALRKCARSRIIRIVNQELDDPEYKT